MDEPSQGLAAKGMLADPGDHFKGRFEVERKYAVSEPAEIRARLESLGAVPFTLANSEMDIFLDWPDGQLAAAGKQQVVRSMQPSNRVLWFVKGPDPDECIATDMEDFDKTLAMLAAQGCIEIDRVEKQRDIWFLGDFHVTLDHVPSLGDFVELAVMTDDEASLSGWATRIETLADELDLSADALQIRSYRAMLAERR
ncbi:MAG: adenylate cyclase [Ahrensia sp.]|nr:adenylate cyclase [Ahrensia sp.]|tara:strand:+ start:30693 stop:31286 length:594 start_codon:yes stop_codon:yes gene_type:complete